MTSRKPFEQYPIKFYSGRFAHRYPAVAIASGLAFAILILLLDVRSVVTAIALGALWVAGVWFRFFRRRGPLVIVDSAGVWTTSRLSEELHGWTQIAGIRLTKDERGTDEVELYVDGSVIALPKPLRVGRSAVDATALFEVIQRARSEHQFHVSQADRDVNELAEDPQDP